MIYLYIILIQFKIIVLTGFMDYLLITVVLIEIIGFIGGIYILIQQEKELNSLEW